MSNYGSLDTTFSEIYVQYFQRYNTLLFHGYQWKHCICMKVNEMMIISGSPGNKLWMDCRLIHRLNQFQIVKYWPSTCAIQSNYINYDSLQMSSINVLPLSFQSTNLNYTIQHNMLHLITQLYLENWETNSALTTQLIEHEQILYNCNNVQLYFIIVS